MADAYLWGYEAAGARWQGSADVRDMLVRRGNAALVAEALVARFDAGEEVRLPSTVPEFRAVYVQKVET